MMESKVTLTGIIRSEDCHTSTNKHSLINDPLCSTAFPSGWSFLITLHSCCSISIPLVGVGQ